MPQDRRERAVYGAESAAGLPAHEAYVAAPPYSDVCAEFDTLREEVRAYRTRLAALERKPAPHDPSLSALQERLGTIEQNYAALSVPDAAAIEATARRIVEEVLESDGVTTRTQQMVDELIAAARTEIGTRLDGYGTRIGALEELPALVDPVGYATMEQSLRALTKRVGMIEHTLKDIVRSAQFDGTVRDLRGEGAASQKRIESLLTELTTTANATSGRYSDLTKRLERLEAYLAASAPVLTLDATPLAEPTSEPYAELEPAPNDAESVRMPSVPAGDRIEHKMAGDAPRRAADDIWQELEGRTYAGGLLRRLRTNAPEAAFVLAYVLNGLPEHDGARFVRSLSTLGSADTHALKLYLIWSEDLTLPPDAYLQAVCTLTDELDADRRRRLAGTIALQACDADTLAVVLAKQRASALPPADEPPLRRSASARGKPRPSVSVPSSEQPEEPKAMISRLRGQYPMLAPRLEAIYQREDSALRLVAEVLDTDGRRNEDFVRLIDNLHLDSGVYAGYLRWAEQLGSGHTDLYVAAASRLSAERNPSRAQALAAALADRGVATLAELTDLVVPKKQDTRKKGRRAATPERSAPATPRAAEPHPPAYDAEPYRNILDRDVQTRLFDELVEQFRWHRGCLSQLSQSHPHAAGVVAYVLRSHAPEHQKSKFVHALVDEMRDDPEGIFGPYLDWAGKLDRPAEEYIEAALHVVAPPKNKPKMRRKRMGAIMLNGFQNASAADDITGRQEPSAADLVAADTEARAVLGSVHARGAD